jgi:hypothetical protein
MLPQSDYRPRLLHVLRTTNVLVDALEVPNLSTLIDLRKSLAASIRELEWLVAADDRKARNLTI